jgi:uncharacterized Zn finger protein
MNPRAVESGMTRCPRCMVLAEYRFLDRGDNALEYEVRCGTCGHVHSESTDASSTDASSAA